MELLIAIPSKGRAGRVTSHKILGDAAGDAVVFCPASERAAYAQQHANVVGVPERFVGITATRNFILDFARERGLRFVIQTDDDAKHFTYFEGDAKAPGLHVADNRKRALFVQGFEMCVDLRTNLWGFQVSYDPKFYREYSPLSFTSVIGGNFMGIVEDGQRFDERLKLKEDYDFSLQSLYHKRRVLRFNKYAWAVEHHDTPGGCKAYRGFDTETQAIKLLQAKWGSRIVSLHPKKAFEIRVRVPIKGI